MYRFYDDLAPYWHLLSEPEDYAEEAAFAGELLASVPDVREVLELGSGGGNNASHLRTRFDLTLVDLSEAMLAASREINPGVAHHQGDMRTVRLGRTFDAVFVHDAVTYMTTEEDLRLAMETAFVHCRGGGVAVFAPDETTETFAPATEHGGSDALDGRGARYLAWSWDPDPTDTWTLTVYAFLVRDADGTVHSVHETHRTGLFSRDTWLGLLTDVGFDARAVLEVTTEDREPREFFVGTR
jgi:SAM-dependent methyltransferase